MLNYPNSSNQAFDYRNTIIVIQMNLNSFCYFYTKDSVIL
jgi:hypothetical protein